MLEQLLAEYENYKSWGGWVAQVFAVVFVTLLFNFFQKRVMNRVHGQAQKTANLWDDAFIEALRRPLSLLIWLVGISFAVQIIETSTDAAIFSAVDGIRDVGVIAIFAWFLLRFIRNAQDNIVARKTAADEEVDHTTVEAIGKLLRVSVVITATLVILQTLGYSVSGVLAFGGIGGIAIGFAAKDLLANFFGGLMIYLDRPFAIGDWIRSPDRDIEGTVEHIGWRQTRIRTFDKRPLYVPNSIFATITVENPSRMTHRRIYETIGIRYDDADKVGLITEEVKAMLMAHPDIDQSQTLMVNFNAFAPSSLDFFIYTFTRTTVWTEYHETKHRILMEIHQIVSKHGAEMAFPTSTVHLPDEVKLAQDSTT